MKLLILFQVLFTVISAISFPAYQSLTKKIVDDGFVVFENVGKNYMKASNGLRKQAPVCLDDSLEVDLDDGTKRFTVARDSSNQTFPVCVDKNTQIILRYFDKIDNYITDYFHALFGDQLKIVDEGNTLDIEDLPSKTHLHVYSKSVEDSDRSISDFSLPFHTDNGLYLLLTPSQTSPLQVQHRNGSVEELLVPDDSIIFLIGTGLSPWLIPQSLARFYAPPHAVPRLSSTRSRTVLARMKVAPVMATNSNSDLTFGEHFYSTLEMAPETSVEERHLERMKRQTHGPNSQHWIGQTTTNKPTRRQYEKIEKQS